ncbi:MAG: hypothetical protein NTW03_19250 [Verrucomicrobia bacterium]|nr:hypothetical protein [Verrucomicrobiota bacterium]
MSNGKNIEMDLVKLANGERLLRLIEPSSGVCLEKKLDPEQPVLRQKERLLSMLEAALAQAEAVAV